MAEKVKHASAQDISYLQSASCTSDEHRRSRALWHEGLSVVIAVLWVIEAKLGLQTGDVHVLKHKVLDHGVQAMQRPLEVIFPVLRRRLTFAAHLLPSHRLRVGPHALREGRGAGKKERHGVAGPSDLSPDRDL